MIDASFAEVRKHVAAWLPVALPHQVAPVPLRRPEPLLGLEAVKAAMVPPR